MSPPSQNREQRETRARLAMVLASKQLNNLVAKTKPSNEKSNKGRKFQQPKLKKTSIRERKREEISPSGTSRDLGRLNDLRITTASPHSLRLSTSASGGGQTKTVSRACARKG